MRRAAALLAVLGLLIHAGLPLLHQARAASSPFGETTLICTGYGVKLVHVADLAGDESQPKQSSLIYYCPLCLASQLANAAVLPVELALPVPVAIALALAAPRTQTVALQDRDSRPRARAPPSFA